MTNEQLLVECKKGLNLSVEPNEDIDGVLLQKILTVKAFLVGAGVKEQRLQTDLAVGVIVVGVSDLWNLDSGEVKFSPVFSTLVSQLALGV